MALTLCAAPKQHQSTAGTKNLRAVQLLLGHNKVESTLRNLGFEVDDALVISEQTDVSL
jgi:hypothetical protein